MLRSQDEEPAVPVGDAQPKPVSGSVEATYTPVGVRQMKTFPNVDGHLGLKVGDLDSK